MMTGNWWHSLPGQTQRKTENSLWPPKMRSKYGYIKSEWSMQVALIKLHVLKGIFHLKYKEIMIIEIKLNS